MIKLLLAAIGLTTSTVIIHGLGVTGITARVARFWLQGKGRKWLGAELLLGRLVIALLVLHLVEAAVWAVFLVATGAVPNLESAAYFSLTSYTTVGYGDVLLPEPWRLLGPIEAAVGVLMLGWSTAVIVAATGRVYREMLDPPAGRGTPEG